MSRNQPIGLFDSGVGGTSIWKEIHQLMPLEHTIYLADSSNAPYGERPREEIIRLSFKNTEKLLDMGAKIIVVACNTATTNAIQKLRAHYKVPFIGIEPAIKPAATYTQTKTIGILATKGTLSSELFAETTDLYSKHVKVIEVVGKGLVEAIEKGIHNTPEVQHKLAKLLQPMMVANIDYLVLGCSHYPYLIPQLKNILPSSVKIIDSGRAVAKQTKAVLESFDLLSPSQQGPPEFFTNGDPKILQHLLQDQTAHLQISHLRF